MDKHRIFQLLRCFFLAFLLAWGAALVTASGIGEKTPPWLWAVWGASALGYTAATTAGKWGRLLIPVLFPLPLAVGVSLPMTLWGNLAALGTCRTVILGKSPWLAGLGSLAGLGLCLLRPDAAPSREGLFLLFTGVGVLLITSHTRFQQPRQGNRLTLTAAPLLAAVFGLILFLTPQQSYVNHSAAIQGFITDLIPSAGILFPGFASDPSPSAPTYITLNQSSPGPTAQRVMTVTMEEPGTLYLRERSYDHYDGTGWAATETLTEVFPGTGSPEQTVEIHTEDPRAYLFTTGSPSQDLTLVGGGLPNPQGLTRYTLSFSTGGFPASGDPAPYLALPEATRLGAASLVEQILPGPGDAPETAAAIGAYLRRGTYTLSSSHLPEEGDSVLNFLEGDMEGSCTRFAAAAAVLLRCAGVPARVAVGYLVTGEGAGTVTDRDAHAWAEYYDPESGSWQILEATPSASPAISGETPAQEEKTAAFYLLPLGILPELIFRIRRGWRRFRLRRMKPNEKALALWREAQVLARLLGHPVSAELAALAGKACFSPHPLTEGELSVFRDALDRDRSCLKKKFFLKRLVHRWVYGVY